ncbi:MAG: hypothetical protein HY907_21495 [Deltaproteobacteria bacterium]|nr:hypothetical protein [Deltaproteobacteria bacterium]
MDGRWRCALALTVLGASVSGCRASESGTTTTHDEIVRPAPGDPQAADDGRAGPCTAFTAEAMRCTTALRAGGESPLAAGAELDPEAVFRQQCRGWLAAGATAADLDSALAHCAGAPCATGAIEWFVCILGGLPEGAVQASSELPPRGVWARIPPRSFDPGKPACETFVEWMMGCTAQLAGGQLQLEVAAASRDAFDEVCAVWQSDPALRPLLADVLRSCADAACGEGGADMTNCIASQFAAALDRSLPP